MPTSAEKLNRVILRVGADAVWQTLLNAASPQTYQEPPLTVEDAVIGVETGFYGERGEIVERTDA